MYELLNVFDDVHVKVHQDGRIETLDHTSLRKNGRKDNRKGKVLKPTKDRYGYDKVVLTKPGVRKTFTVHRLVALAFIPNPENKETVNHRNGVKDDNRVENLEWATHSEQKIHSIVEGLCQRNIDALVAANKLKSKPVIYDGIKYDSIKQAARENCVHERVIRKEGVMPNE